MELFWTEKNPCPGTREKAEAAEGVPQNRWDCNKLARKARKHSNLVQLWHSARWKPTALFKSLLNFTKLFSTAYSSSRYLTQQQDPYWVAVIPHIWSFLFAEKQETNERLSLFSRWRMFWTRYKLAKMFCNGTTRAQSAWTPSSSTDLSCNRSHSLKSSAEGNSELASWIFSIKTTLAFPHKKESIPHIKNSSQILAWSRLSLSQNMKWKSAAGREKSKEELLRTKPECMSAPAVLQCPHWPLQACSAGHENLCRQWYLEIPKGSLSCICSRWVRGGLWGVWPGTSPGSTVAFCWLHSQILLQQKSLACTFPISQYLWAQVHQESSIHVKDFLYLTELLRKYFFLFWFCGNSAVICNIFLGRLLVKSLYAFWISLWLFWGWDNCKDSQVIQFCLPDPILDEKCPNIIQLPWNHY